MGSMVMSENHKKQKSELKQRSAAIHLSVAISAIYIGIASGLLVFILQKNPDLTTFGYALISAIVCICAILFHMFAAEFFMLSIWHQNRISEFAFYGSICYGIGQAFLFVAMAFIVRSLGHKALAVTFLSLIVIYWVLYYWIRVKLIPETDHTASRWFARGLILIIYLFAVAGLIRY